MRRGIFITLFVLAACAPSPTGIQDTSPASTPRFDGGFLGGSGNVVAPPEAAESESGTQTATASTDAAADSLSEPQRGFLGGSGN
jgi:hypothetical protein